MRAASVHGGQHARAAGHCYPHCAPRAFADAVLEDATASASKEVQDSNIRDIRNIGVGVSTVEAWKKTFVTE